MASIFFNPSVPATEQLPEPPEMIDVSDSMAMECVRAFDKLAEVDAFEDFLGHWWYEWRDNWRDCAVDITIECPESHDSSEIWTFEDDSQVRVENPAQDAFRARVRWWEDHTSRRVKGELA